MLFVKKYYFFLAVLSILTAFAIYSCSGSEDDNYTPVTAAPLAPVSPVTVDLTLVPYSKLSEYKFFEGPIKDQKPAAGLLPFAPASPLFSDYALKKRFVWMPAGSRATYNGDNKVLELPSGAALVKTFYYDNVQNITPVGGTRIIETRVIIRKGEGLIFADYVWNAEQTEAYLDSLGNGSYTEISWKDENNVIKGTNYRIPAQAQCMVCHKSRSEVAEGDDTKYIPIGIKPQNLNWDYSYDTGAKNQLRKWIEQGYLEDNFSLPSPENTTVNYNDTSKPLDQRARSYVDANCSHCHSDDRHCDYRPMRFAYHDTGNAESGLANMGVCVNTSDMQDFPPELSRIVAPGKIEKSMLYYRINTTNETYRMPLHGRTVIHEEGVALIRDWINSLRPCE